jgi:hypothetical protein
MNDMEMSNPDASDELFLDGTDWLYWEEIRYPNRLQMLW